MNIIERRSLA